MDQALATAPMRWRVLRSTNTGYNHAGSLRGFKATASSCSNSQTAHATHSTPSPPHSRQDHETPTSPQTPDNKLHHRHAKVFKPLLRQTPPIVDLEPALSGRLAAKPTAYAALPTYCTGAAADQRTLGPALNRLRGRRLVHQLPRGRLTI